MTEPDAAGVATPRRPLADIRILAVEQYGAGPYASLQLADLGADVIKIEDPRVGGDVGRQVPPYQHDDDSLFFETFNRNKRSISLDLSTRAGREVFERMVPHADVVHSNLRGDVPAAMRLLYADLKHLNPRIVCSSLTGFGMTGPRREQPGYDYILQGLAGWMDITGEPDGPPTKSGLSLVDYSGGLVAAISILAGVHAARRDGVGMDCDVSLFDTAVALLTYPATWHLTEAFAPQRTRHSAHPSLVPFQAFATSDGWIVVGCAKEKFWQRLVHVLGDPDWASDATAASFADRLAHRDTLIGHLERAFGTRPSAEWLELLTAAGVPCGPVNDIAAALRDEHTEARGLVIETEHPRWGTVRQVASPVRVGEPATEHRRAPTRNEHLAEVMREVAGLTDTEVTEFGARGAFGASPTNETSPTNQTDRTETDQT